MNIFRKIFGVILTTYCISISLASANDKNLSPQDMSSAWLSSWYAPIDTAGPSLPPQTIRQWLRLSVGGDQLRLHFSNLHGSTPLVLSSVYVARSKGQAKHDSEQQQEVKFSGLGTSVIAPGEEIVSDPLSFKTKALEEIAISLFIPAAVEVSSLHNTAMQNARLLVGKDLTRKTQWYDGKDDDTRYFLSEVEVLGNMENKTIVAFGDSLTDGVGIELDQYHRWTDFLANRLQQNPQTKHLAVVNAGIAGNRFLRDAKAPFIGTAGINRFNHDVLQRSGVTAVIVSIGTNDISANSAFKESDQVVSLEELIDGYRQLIKLAHERSIRIFVATIKPRGGAGGILPHTPEAEALRVRINQWMRESKEFDAVIDFDLMLRDPERPDRLLPRYDSGDHTHPNAEGYRVMAQGIDLRLFN